MKPWPAATVTTVITGEKHYTTNGTGGTTMAPTSTRWTAAPNPRQAPDESLAVIAVPGAAAGISVIDVYDKLGHRGVVTPE